ncbi:IMPACT family protein [Brackiella oedipodis]|uniref:IMPACT family protein n=1 Tax=Brackiella oedipodis TaxID=124225 RepID=UPI00048AF469|nr:YigZ family protein [Brackiella oedipodis]
MSTEYELAAPQQFEEEIKKSRFIALAAPVTSAEQALDFFAQQHHADATHNCWAYKLARDYRFNDDGEPGGTAGRPILQAIEGKDLINTAVLVIRYFGGTKLGTGGLIRAYGGCAAKCLQTAERRAIIPSTQVFCTALYSDMDLIKSRLVSPEVLILSENFNNEGVEWWLQIPNTLLATAQENYINLTRGQGIWRPATED